jgi:hypothetical protein
VAIASRPPGAAPEPRVSQRSTAERFGKVPAVGDRVRRGTLMGQRCRHQSCERWGESTDARPGEPAIGKQLWRVTSPDGETDGIPVAMLGTGRRRLPANVQHMPAADMPETPDLPYGAVGLPQLRFSCAERKPVK